MVNKTNSDDNYSEQRLLKLKLLRINLFKNVYVQLYLHNTKSI